MAKAVAEPAAEPKQDGPLWFFRVLGYIDKVRGLYRPKPLQAGMHIRCSCVCT